MNTTTRSLGRNLWVSVRAMVAFTVLCGIVYTLVVTGIGQLLIPWQANGSPVQDASGQTVGSALIGQSFTDADGNPLPQYFQSRPSAAGDGYDGSASSGSNYGPNNGDLTQAIQDRKSQIAQFDGVTEDQVPADAVTASGSGLDPHISPAYAAIQVNRVATERGLTAEQVSALVTKYTTPRDLGFLGEPVVNVLQLNLALDELKG